MGFSLAPTPDIGSARARAPSAYRAADTSLAARTFAATQVGRQTNIPRAGLSRIPETTITTDNTVVEFGKNSKPRTMADFKLGDIIRIPHLVPSLDQQGKRIYIDEISSYICPKIRYAIVLAKYPLYMLVLPVFSSNKQGLEKKCSDYRLTALSVWNPKYMDPVVQSMLTENALTADGSHPWYAGSHVNLTNGCYVGYDWPIETSQGALRESDRSLLLRRFRLLQEAAYQSNPRAYFEIGVNAERVRRRAEAESSKPHTVAGKPVAGSTVSYARTAGRGK